MPDKVLGNIVIILAGTKHPGNIGSAARAMNNMGLGRLRLAAAQCSIDEESVRMAKAGRRVLESARVFRSVKSATRDLRLLAGTTGKTGGNRARTLAPRALAPQIIGHAATQKVGVLFGPEDTGLVDEDLLPCQWLIRIPTDTGARSINLAQAVMLVSYELFLASLGREPSRTPKLATLEQAEAMYAHLEDALLEIGFLHRQNARHMMFTLRRLLGRARLEPADVGVLRGIARQIGWYAEQRRTPGPGAGRDAEEKQQIPVSPRGANRQDPEVSSPDSPHIPGE